MEKEERVETCMKGFKMLICVVDLLDLFVWWSRSPVGRLVLENGKGERGKGKGGWRVEKGNFEEGLFSKLIVCVWNWFWVLEFGFGLESMCWVMGLASWGGFADLNWTIQYTQSVLVSWLAIKICRISSWLFVFYLDLVKVLLKF